MLARALIILLIAINLGVAIWWLLGPEPAATPAAEATPGVPRLQLLSEAKPLAAGGAGLNHPAQVAREVEVHLPMVNMPARVAPPGPVVSVQGGGDEVDHLFASLHGR